jgi:preprotein translocase subunit SecA
VQVEEAPTAPTLDVDNAGPVPTMAPPTRAAPSLPTDSEPAPEPVTQKLPPALRAKGLDVSRPSHVEYSAPSLDGAGGVVHTAEDGDGDGQVDVDPNANRAERRRQQRAQRKNRR